MPGISTSSATTTFSLSGVSTTDPLLNEIHKVWSANSLSGVSLTCSFPWINGASAYWQSNYSTTSEPQAATHTGLNATQITAAINALQTWANVANVSFTQVADTATNVGDFRFAFSSAVGSTYWGECYYPGFSASAADVWINPTYATSSDWSAGSYNYDALIHEIGHGLGLKHPGNYTGAGGTPPYLPANLDYRTYTIMSYNDLNPWFLDPTTHKYIEVVPETPMVYDIAAIQYLYGANNKSHTGNDTYTFAPSHPFYMAIWDAGGIDTISVSNFSTNCTIDLTPGHYSSILYINQGTTTNLYTGTNNLGIAFGAVIENATGGTGNDKLIGNNANNILNGGGGTNTAVERGNFADYIITYNASTLQYTVTDKVAYRDGVDTLSNIQQIQFTDGVKTLADIITPITSPKSIAVGSLESWEYLDSWPDLQAVARIAFGSIPIAADSQFAANHYTAYGISEGRSISFDTAEYLASNLDLIKAFGPQETGVSYQTAEIQAAEHYFQYGYQETRPTSTASAGAFNPVTYLADNPDLIAYYGLNNYAGAEQHFITYGYLENRPGTGLATALNSPLPTASNTGQSITLVGVTGINGQNYATTNTA